MALKILGIHVDYQEKIVSEILLNRDINPLERIIRFYVEGVYAKRDLCLRTGSFIARMDLEQGSRNQRFRSLIDRFFQRTKYGLEICVEDCAELKVLNSYSPLELSYKKTLTMLLKKEWRHLIPKHDELPVHTFSYHDQLKPLISSQR